MNCLRSVATLALLLVLCLGYQTLSRTSAQTAKTLKGSDYSLSAFENEMLQEINLVRTRPQDYAANLEQLRAYYKGNIFQPPGRGGLQTQEGTAALDEVIGVLKQARPLNPYNLSRGMCLGANVLVKDQGLKGLTGHKGSDGSFCEQRLERYGAWEGTVGENLSYGKDTARQRIMTLLIDDGVANRGHRQRLLSPDYKVVGVSCGDHAQLGVMCVITFAGGFADGGAGSNSALKKF